MEFTDEVTPTFCVELQLPRKIPSARRQIQDGVISGITAELTRRRDFIHASPDQSRCETRSRRSRPTICWAAIRKLLLSVELDYVQGFRYFHIQEMIFDAAL